MIFFLEQEMLITDQQQQATKSLFDRAVNSSLKQLRRNLNVLFQAYAQIRRQFDLFPEHARGRTRSMIVDRRFLSW